MAFGPSGSTIINRNSSVVEINASGLEKFCELLLLNTGHHCFHKCKLKLKMQRRKIIIISRFDTSCSFMMKMKWKLFFPKKKRHHPAFYQRTGKKQHPWWYGGASVHMT